MRAQLAVVAALLLCGPRVHAETIEQAYQGALRAYYAGKYGEAIEGFERVLAVPMEDPDVHFNLGCAYFRRGQLGRSIYHFERALSLDPGDEDASFNLKTVRALADRRVKDELKGAMGDPWWVRLVTSASATTWAVALLVVWWLTAAILLLLRYVHPGPARAGLIAVCCFVAALVLAGGLVLAGRAYVDERVNMAIVLPDTLPVREGPARSAQVSFRMHAGLKIRVEAREGRWARIRLANGLEGWVPNADIGAL